MLLKNQKVTILGARRSGLALARLVRSLGGQPRISDQKEIQGKEELRALPAEFEENGHTQVFIEASDLLVLSPGIPLNSQPVQWARQKNIPVCGEIEFAARFCRKPVIAVTGSNGKTTVVTLVDRVLKAAGLRSCLCGNIGEPFSAHVLDEAVDYFVLEVSSFQMESVTPGGFQPRVAVWLNFNSNHLDRHADLDEYFSAKSRIFLNQTESDFAVLKGTDPRIRALAGSLKARVVFYTELVEHGTENPNWQAVLAVARILDIPDDVCFQVFKKFTGVEHRLELVRALDGVDYINDSKATTAESGQWALDHVNGPAVMICGGRDKNIDFSGLKETVARKVKAMILIGEAKEKLRMVFEGCVPLELRGTLEEAVAAARQAASPGDCVLLSPMCASFDMFKDYEHRGREFKAIVQALEPRAAKARV